MHAVPRPADSAAAATRPARLSTPVVLASAFGRARRAAPSAVTVLVLAQIVGTAVAGADPVPAKAAALAFAAAIVAVGTVLNGATPIVVSSPVSTALVRSAALAAGAALLVVLNGAAHGEPSRPVGLGVAVAVLTLTVTAATDFLHGALGEPARARLCALVTLAVTAATPLWLGPMAERLAQSRAVVDAVVAVSPLTYLAVMSNYDYLRSDWFYTGSALGSLRFDYPAPGTMTAAYLAIGLAFLCADRWLYPRKELR